MKSRSKNSYQTHVYGFIKSDILVVCPNCLKQAVVKSGNFSFRSINENDIKVICINCGYSKLFAQSPNSIVYSSNGKVVGRHYIMGGGIDPFFYLPLWLRTDCEGNTLWAYNFEHLNFLRIHVEAKLRERNGQELSNKSLGSRLPKWMTSRKNRELILRKIKELQTNYRQRINT